MNNQNLFIFVPELSNALETAGRECKNDYAQTYLRTIPQAIQEGEQMGVGAEHGVRVQLLYVLSNMSHWKGEVARDTKAVLKKYADSKTLSIFIKGTDILNN